MGNYCNYDNNENNNEFNVYDNKNLINNNDININNISDYCNKCCSYFQKKLCDDSNSISFMTYIFGEPELEKK